MKTNNTKIIGFRGRKGVGKNFCADIVADILRDDSVPGMSYDGSRVAVEIGAFAEPLKNFCVSVLGLDKEQCYGTDEQKNSKTRYSWKNIPQEIRDKYPDKSGKMTGREVMQVFGTDMIRDFFHKDIWVDALKRDIDNSGADYYLITDVRFLSEVETIRSWGGEVWFVDGPQRGEDDTKNDGHPTEREAGMPVAVDLTIDNNIDMSPAGIRQQALSYLKSR